MTLIDKEDQRYFFIAMMSKPINYKSCYILPLSIHKNKGYQMDLDLMEENEMTIFLWDTTTTKMKQTKWIQIPNTNEFITETNEYTYNII